MFNKSIIFLLILILSLGTAVPALAATTLSPGTTIPGGNVSGTWDLAGSPYLIEGDITIPTGQTLAIDPGVEVLFQSWYRLTVNGALLADGTASAPILFGGGHPSAGWLGIRFVNAPDGSLLNYAIVENGQATGAAPLNKGGGIYIENSNPIISHSTIRNNLAKSSGGGLYLTNSNATLFANTIVNNTAGLSGGSASGGGLTILNSDPIVEANIISGNSVSVSGSFSTPSGSGGGLFVRSSNATFTGNLINDNHVYGHLNSKARGGGFYLCYGSPTFVNNTITGNSVENSAGVYSVKEGGGIYSYYSSPVFVNNILWNDTPEEAFIYGASATFAYSDVQGGQAGIVTDNATINWEPGNLDIDPLFVDVPAGDFSLQAGSPAVDAATAYFEWNGTTIVDLPPDDYVGPAPDMGAFEYGIPGGQNQPPVAVASVTPDHGSAPLTVQFSSDGSYDPDGAISAYAWDFGDGNTFAEANPSHTYTSIDVFQATLTVTDDDGATHSNTVSIEVTDGTTVWGGDVSGVWSVSGSPYLIEGDITVPAGQTLTIEPGVEVLFQSWYRLTVNGTLIADGAESAPILFGGGHPSAGWLGIRFINASDGSLLNYAIVENGRATGADPLNKGGGIYIENSNPVISHSTIRNNLAKASGGGLYLVNSNAILFANTIINNTAGLSGGSASGGGLTIRDANPSVEANIISGNSISISGGYTTPSGSGGGLYVRNSDATFTGNLISDNHVYGSLNSNARGGGLYLYYGSPNFVNNTISGNSVENGAGVYSFKEGGGIYTYHANPTFVNTILWNDTPEELFAADYGFNSTYTFAYADIQGGQAGIVTNNSVIINWLTGNIDQDPLFVDAANGDFSLQPNSPAVDAGTAYFEWNGIVLVDLTPEDYNGLAPDMGAFESNYSSNQPPIAIASADPVSGSSPLVVQFSAEDSHDPDGEISAYAWDFGDGNTSTEASPPHTYADAGTYEATLTVTDDAGATGSAAVTIDVTPASPQQLFVQEQKVTRERVSRRFWRGVDTLLITDENNQPVAGVTVTVSYSGPNEGKVSSVTDADGIVTLYTDPIRRPQGTWCFDVVEVVKVGYTYKSSTSDLALQCEVNSISSETVIESDTTSPEIAPVSEEPKQ